MNRWASASPAQWLERFRQVVNQPEDSINLAEAALLIATDEYPELDIAAYLNRLDTYALQVQPRIDRASSPREKIDALNDFLFREMQYRGNRESYYDPRNSYLNEVLDRRVGLPITLSVIYIQVGQRLGFPIYGVGLPGHFVVKWYDAEAEIFIDPFDQGTILDEYAMLRLIEETYRARVQLHREWLEAVGPRSIVTRLLNNLKGIFLQSENFERAFQVTEKMLVLQPHSDELLREAGLLAFRTGLYQRAADFLGEYLLRFPEATDASQINAMMRSAWVVVTRWN